MPQRKLTVLFNIFIMPLALLPLRAAAQMQPVTAISTTTTSEVALGKLFLSASDHILTLLPVSRISRDSLPPQPFPETSSSSPEFAPAAPDPAAPAPVTLPPKPAQVLGLSAPRSGDQPRVRPFHAAAFGLTASTLGPGGELAIPIARTLNLRVGASYLRWHHPFSLDGINYDPGLNFTAGRATIDWFPHHGAFHISAGALYFRNRISSSADVAEGQTFTLGDTTYINSVDDPIHGTAAISYGKRLAPMLLLGFGNLLPRSGRHLSVPFEIGGAYMEPPTLKLNLAGTACTTQGCFNAATDTEVQSNLKTEITNLQGNLRLLQVYPIVSLGLACRF